VTSPTPDNPAGRPELALSPVVTAPTTPAAAARARFFLFVNGINRRENDFGAWHLSACEWIQSPRTPPTWRADVLDNYVGVFDRWARQGRIVTACCEKLTRHQRQYAAAGVDVEVVGVGHSNGCPVLCGALRENPDLRVDELHLIASAERADCDANGLNAAVARGQVDRVVCYCSADDEALRLGEWTHWLSYLNAKWGYGNMGRVGPLNPAGNRIRSVWFPTFLSGRGLHSDYFKPENFDRMMGRVINHGDGPDDLPTFDLPPVGR
jgi:hypothetical protein